MAHRIIETLIGRLITDEAFRSHFLESPETLLLDLKERGFELSPTEIAALVNTDRHLWTRAAEALDPRLQKVALPSDRRPL